MTRLRATRDDDGFTLIELLVVIIIIGILAAIAIPVFLNQRKKGYDAQAKSDIRNTIAQLETYAVDYGGAFPNGYTTTSDTDLTVNTNGFKMAKSPNVQSLVIRLAAGGGSTGTTYSYVIAAQSDSGKGFCYDSSQAGRGVYANNAGTVSSTSGC